MACAEPGSERPLRRIASVIGLADERTDEYVERHREVWPEVLTAISAVHFTNYSIYRHGDLLFSYFEYRGADYEGDMARLAENPAMQRWWKITDPMQRPLRSHPDEPWWTELTEVFHAD